MKLIALWDNKNQSHGIISNFELLHDIIRYLLTEIGSPTDKMQLVFHCHLWPLWLCHVFSHYLINGMIFGKELLNTKLYFDFVYKFYLKYFCTYRWIQRVFVITVHRSSCKVLLLFSDFNETWVFSTDFRKKFKYQISSHSVERGLSCSMRKERQIWWS